MTEIYYPNLGSAMAAVDQGSFVYGEQMGPYTPGTELDQVRAAASDAEAANDQLVFERKQAEAAEAAYDKAQAAANGVTVGPTIKQSMTNVAILTVVGGLVLWMMMSKSAVEA